MRVTFNVTDITLLTIPLLPMLPKQEYVIHKYLMTHPSHSTWFNYHSDIWRGTQIMKFHFMKFSQTPFYALPLRPKYRGADKSLARPRRKQATVTEIFDFNISYL
jgi:hypothetical protein